MHLKDEAIQAHKTGLSDTKELVKKEQEAQKTNEPAECCEIKIHGKWSPLELSSGQVHARKG